MVILFLREDTQEGAFPPDKKYMLYADEPKKVAAEPCPGHLLRLVPESYSAFIGLMTSSMKFPEFSRSAAAF